jgi:uncharacterized protein (TIGR02147 family)
MYAFRKAGQRSFSYRYFSRTAGFASPNFLKLVIQGKRGLTARSAGAFARALKLGRAEAEFFHALVDLNQATSSEEKLAHAERLVSLRPFRRHQPLAQAQFRYYTHWYFVAVRELMARRDFRPDPDWIARQLEPKISPSEARQALEELERLGMVRRDDSGALTQSTAVVSTGDLVASATVAGWHREMLRLAAESIDRFPATSRELSSATVTLSRESALRAKAMIQQVREQILKLAENDAAPERVYQVGLQLFPLSEEGPSS